MSKAEGRALSQLTCNMENGRMYGAVRTIVPADMRSTGAAMHMLAASASGLRLALLWISGILAAASVFLFLATRIIKVENPDLLAKRAPKPE